MTELIETLREELAEAKAELEQARHSALVDAVAEANRVGGGCDCNFAPCEHDQVRIRIVSAIAQLDAAPAEGEPVQELIDAALAAAPPAFRVICGCICYCSPGDKVCWKCGHPAHESSGAVHGGCCEFTFIPRSTAAPVAREQAGADWPGRGEPTEPGSL